jgi:hypothetical protein
VHPETGVRREVYDVGYVSDWLEPLFEQELRCRVIVTRRAAPADGELLTVGKQVGEYVYELFVTSHPVRCLLAADVVQLYLHRGSFETVLADSARIGDCRQCHLAPQCLGRNASGEMPRQVSGIRTRLEPVRRPKVTHWQEQEEDPPLETPCQLRWCDVGGRAIRRWWFQALRIQQVKLEEEEIPPLLQPSPPTSPQVLTRAQRAHARLSW